MQTRNKRQSSLNFSLSEQLSKRVKIDNNNDDNTQHMFMDIDKCEKKTIINNVQASIFLLVKFIMLSIYIGCKLRLQGL